MFQTTSLTNQLTRMKHIDGKDTAQREESLLAPFCENSINVGIEASISDI